MLRAGKYDQKIKFKEFGKVSNGSGGFITSLTPTVILATFARISQLKQGRSIEELQIGLPPTFEVGVQVRYGFLPKKGMVVEWQGDDYQLISTPKVAKVRISQEWVFHITRPDNG